FYRSLTRYEDSLRVDYDRLAAWITQQVGGPSALFSGAYYYIGLSADAPPAVEGFLKGLELRPGYFVKREPRVRRSGRCPHGGAAFRAERARVHERVPGRAAPSRLARAAAAAAPASEAELERGLAELQRAEARLPHVSRGYFVMRWKSHQLPQVGAEREALVQQLLDAGRIEEFQVRDAEGRLVTAIRSRARDGALREPSGDVALPG